MQLLQALNWRYAVKKFSEDKVSSVELRALLDATRLSASSYGLQPYKIIVVESKEVRQRLLPYSYGQDKILHSSHLIVFAVHTLIGDVTVDRYINKHAQANRVAPADLAELSDHMKSALAVMKPQEKNEWARQQAYIALGNLLTSAALMKIDSCPMAGFDKEGYDSVLGLAEQELASTVICPIGRRHLEDRQANSPKVRFGYRDIVLEI